MIIETIIVLFLGGILIYKILQKNNIRIPTLNNRPQNPNVYKGTFIKCEKCGHQNQIN